MENRVNSDIRGFFIETYQKNNFVNGNISVEFVQDNHVKSIEKFVLRGLHYQLHYPQSKLIRVIKGEIFDVAVDIRKSSPTFKKWVGATLSEENNLQMYIPEGFAHGYCTMIENTEVFYKCSDYYNPKDEKGIAWVDPDISIDWPYKSPILSEKDKNNPLLKFAELPD